MRTRFSAYCKGKADYVIATTHPDNDQLRSVTREAFGAAFENLPRVRGERVKWARGLGLEGTVARLLPPGDAFDGALARAVSAFQQANGLLVDHVVGPKTWAAICVKLHEPGMVGYT